MIHSFWTLRDGGEAAAALVAIVVFCDGDDRSSAEVTLAAADGVLFGMGDGQILYSLLVEKSAFGSVIAVVREKSSRSRSRLNIIWIKNRDKTYGGLQN